MVILQDTTHQGHGEVGGHLRGSIGDELDGLWWEVVLQGEPHTAGVVIVRRLHQSPARSEGPEVRGGQTEAEGGQEDEMMESHVGLLLLQTQTNPE